MNWELEPPGEGVFESAVPLWEAIHCGEPMLRAVDGAASSSYGYIHGSDGGRTRRRAGDEAICIS